MIAPPVVELQALRRTFPGDIVALEGLDLTVRRGEMVAVMGTSGSGKSSLLNLLGCLDRPTSGTYRLDGVAVESLDDDALADLRNACLGFVFQGFNLLPRTTALEQVMLPMLYDRHHRFPKPEARARTALERVGLGHRLRHYPNELSGGQQQRVAVARALVTRPALLLADEPTGNLDSRTTLDMMCLFQELHAEGVTMLIVTHETDVARYCDRALTLRDGRLVDDRAVSPADAATDLAHIDLERHP